MLQNIQALKDVLVMTRGAHPNPVKGLQGLVEMLCTHVQAMQANC
jgi:hypothetical protein